MTLRKQHSGVKKRPGKRTASRSRPAARTQRTRDTSCRFTPTLPAAEVQVDQAAIDALKKVYRSLTPADRDAKRATYEHDLKTIYEGRKLGEPVAQFQARTAGNPRSDKPVTSATPAQMNFAAAYDAAVAASDAGGTVSHVDINPLLTHGYQLPPGRYADLKDLAVLAGEPQTA